MIGMIMFGVALIMLMFGFPVAFTFGGVALFLASLQRAWTCSRSCPTGS